MSLRGLARPGLVLLAALAGWATCAGPVQAAYGPFALVAGSPSLRLQADYAYDAAISANGEYVAYTGSIASQPGIYRQDLTTGEVQVVALGAATGVPSISEDGQYVSFTTSDDPLTGEPAGECSSVYVRDMSKRVEAGAGKSSEEAGAYRLASAVNGGTQSLTYVKPTTKGQPCGAAAAYRVAISGNGGEVVFTVLSESDLAGPQTAPDQVAVRYLDSEQTELVSATRASLEGSGEPQPVPGGAALAGPSTTAPKLLDGVPTSASTAAISAEGNTVAWMGIDVQEQTDLDTPPPTPSKGAYADEYAEPLWRQIATPAAGSRALTRSVLAGGDASAPECPPSCTGGLNLLWNQGEETTLALGPILGSFLSSQGFAVTGTNTDPLDVVTPQLSADGLEVALLSTQPTDGEEPVYPNNDGPPPTANAFVVNMEAGLSRAQAITRLTAWASLNLRELALAGPIEEIAISPDGTHVAFITARAEFPLAPPALITAPLSQAIHGQVYVADLPAGTLEFISQGYEGQPANGGSLDVSLDEHGDKLALASTATNLAFGTFDAGTSVFVTEAIGSRSGSGAQSVSPPPQGPDPSPLWSISATASRGAKGSLLLYVSVPGAGSLAASASATVPTTVTTYGKGRTSRDSSKQRRGRRGAGHSTQTTLAVRQIASTTATVKGAGVLELHLTPASRYRPLLAGPGGLYANIKITFTATGHSTLSQKLISTFQTPAQRPHAKGLSSPKRAGHPGAGRSSRR
jgi:hypothetical protein